MEPEFPSLGSTNAKPKSQESVLLFISNLMELQ